MTACRSFSGTLIFGGLAAAMLPVFMLLYPVGSVHSGSGLAIYITALAAIYGTSLAPSLRRALAVGVLSSGAGLLVLALTRDVVVVAVAAALILGFARSASLRQSNPARSLLVELLLGCGGLMLARALAAPSPVALGMALWGYFLVQSCYFLLAGWGARQPAAGVEDPFDRARRQILELLGDARGSF
jgi:hypothetical protein